MPLLDYPREQLLELLADPGDPPIPELTDAVARPDLHTDRAPIRLLFEESADTLADIRTIPQLTYTLYRNVQRFTDRIPYQNVRGERRTKMSLAGMKVVLGDDSYLDILHDYIWATCEETNWLLPQVDHLGIELRVPATALDLAEIIIALSDRIEDKAKARVRREIEDRVFVPYLLHPEGYRWYRGKNNWNGVINGAIGASFLLLETDPHRLSTALETVLIGLNAFLETAFEPDGASGEGTGYWMYGLSNFICFSELLRSRTRGTIDLLALDRVRQIARYPVDVMLSPGHYFPYSDCRETVGLQPGLVTRLVERTGVEDLRGALAEPSNINLGVGHFHDTWRNVFWWDGARPGRPTLSDSWLRDSDVVRIVSSTGDGAPIAVAAKAGNNGVSHNHNDVGTFVIHVDGETLLCDPESGLYDLYRRHGRNANLFANSIGHSVPKIGDAQQSEGSQFGGSITACDTSGETKRIELDLTGAYEAEGLKQAARVIEITGDTVTIADAVTFDGAPSPVEEAFVSWLDPEIDGATATLRGDRHALVLTIARPEGAAWQLQTFEEESAANHKKGILKRLTFTVTAAPTIATRVSATIEPAVRR